MCNPTAMLCVIVGAALAFSPLPGACPARIPLIIDTDCDTDDIQAIGYLLQTSLFDIKAITVDSNGWTSQWAGVNSVLKLTQRFGRPDIPVAYGTLNGKTNLNNVYLNSNLPTNAYKPNDFLTTVVPLPPNPRPPSWQSAAQLILAQMAAQERPGCMVILALGPLTNLADALQRDPKTFLAGINTLVFSGGNFHPYVAALEAGDAAPLAAQSAALLAAHAAGSGYPYPSRPAGASWNVFSDPISASAIFSCAIERLVLVTHSAQDALPLAPSDIDAVPPLDCVNEQWANNTLFGSPIASGEAFSKLRWWDESAAVVAMQIAQRGIPAPGDALPTDVCTNWIQVPYR